MEYSAKKFAQSKYYRSRKYVDGTPHRFVPAPVLETRAGYGTGYHIAV